MAWFVVYEFKRVEGESHKSNIILRHTHPVTWISNPPAVFSNAGMNNILLFFAEIPDDVVEEVVKANFCSVSD